MRIAKLGIHQHIYKKKARKKCHNPYLFCLDVYMELQDFPNGFLKIKQKETQINVINNDKSSEIHVSESIIKNSDCEKLLDIKIDSKLQF